MTKKAMHWKTTKYRRKTFIITTIITKKTKCKRILSLFGYVCIYYHWYRVPIYGFDSFLLVLAFISFNLKSRISVIKRNVPIPKIACPVRWLNSVCIILDVIREWISTVPGIAFLIKKIGLFIQMDKNGCSYNFV